MNKLLSILLLVSVGIIGVLLYYLNSGNINKGKNMNTTPTNQNQVNYKAELISSKDIKPGEAAELKYTINNDKGEILKDFIEGHEKIMHLIIVREDLQYFQHLHPEYNPQTGKFTTEVVFPTDGPYRIYPDFIPGHSTGNHMMTPVVADFTLMVGDQDKYKPETLSTANNQMQFGDYEVKHSFSGELKSESPISYTLNVMQNGQPVTNLEKYLGALGHSVILKEGSLQYIHTHAGEAKEMDHSGGHEMTEQEPTSTGPDITFSTTFPQPGKYKIFTQFQHQGQVITTDYIIEVK